LSSDGNTPEDSAVEFAGEFETHITVRAPDQAAIDALHTWARDRGLAFHHIVLARGQTPSQPMNGRHGRGTRSGELATANQLRRELALAGFVVSRVKIEASPRNRDVPRSDAEAANHSGRYFEHHVKLALDPHADLAVLTAIAQEHAAHLSRNARRARDDGRHERFVTQRCQGVGAVAAGAALRTLLAALAEYEVVSVEEEYVVHDSDPGVDAGWLENGGAS
jgi:hypothetical protein